MILLLLACTSSDDDSSLGDDTQAEVQLCSPLAGFETGATASFDTPQAVQDEKGYRYWYTQTVESMEVGYEQTAVTVVQQAWQTGGGYDSYSAELTLEYLCDADGVWYTSSRREWSATLTGGGEDSGWVEGSFTGYLMLPADPSTPWTADWAATFVDNAGTEVEDARSYLFTPTAMEEVETPAGSYTALRVDGTQAGAPIGTWWYAEGHGLVMTPERERVSAFE